MLAEKNTNSSRGVVVYLTLVFLGIILLVGLSIISLFTREFRMSSNIKMGAKAIFAAETGIETTLERFRLVGETLPKGATYQETLSNGAEYKVKVLDCCTPLKLKSVGKSGPVKRAIEIAY